MPVIASLNAFSPGGWAKYARLLGDAGADAIELNVYRVAADAVRSATQVEADDLALVADVKAAVDVPVALKLSPFYSSMANFAVRAVQAGADGLVLFNRFYQPDIDVETLDIVPRARAVVAVGAAPTAAVDRDPPTDSGRAHQPRRHERGGNRSRRRQGAAGRGRRRDDHVGGAPSRP